MAKKYVVSLADDEREKLLKLMYLNGLAWKSMAGWCELAKVLLPPVNPMMI